jgi:acetoin utilization deacetylase AcuC-like enzyme
MDGYRMLSALMVALAERVCEGRLILFHEGGYSAPYVPFCTAAAVESLVGVNLGIVDLYASSHELARSQTIYSHETHQALLAARAWHQRWWNI